jgi:HK97 gp10 family phage protein
MPRQVAGIELNTRELDRISGELEARAERLISATAFQIQADAKTFAPVDTGALRASIHVEPQAERLTRQIADGVEYGIYQELGTYKMAAHPFMVPAVEKVRSKFLSMWRELFR